MTLYEYQLLQLSGSERRIGKKVLHGWLRSLGGKGEGKIKSEGY